MAFLICPLELNPPNYKPKTFDGMVKVEIQLKRDEKQIEGEGLEIENKT